MTVPMRHGVFLARFADATVHFEHSNEIVVDVAEPGPNRCRHVRRIINPARPESPTPEMVERMHEEAVVCLDAIKRIPEANSVR